MFPFFILAKRVGGESTADRGGKTKITTAERGNNLLLGNIVPTRGVSLLLRFEDSHEISHHFVRKSCVQARSF